MDIKVINLDKTIVKLNGLSALADEVVIDGFEDMIEEIVPNVQAYTPVDTGHTKDAIGGTIDKGPPVVATIQADPQKVEPVVVASIAGGSRPHWPPWGPGSELAGWAKRHGIPPFLVARAIATKGTIKRFGYGGAKMFEKGLNDSMGFIVSKAKDMGASIVKRF